MLENGREQRWSEMDIEEKKQFDLSQAKELNNVLQSKALRSLTMQEEAMLDPKRVMTMRWVLCTESDGAKKSRLAVLGFQMPGISEVETAAPTSARISRNLLLVICANNSFRLKAGDVTAAFLQAEESLEDLGLTVWAPPGLAVQTQHTTHIRPLRVTKAFYGLVQAPRCWFNDTSRMEQFGWKRILADRCRIARG